MSIHRINNDINGNPRHVIHYLLVSKEGESYESVVKRANKLGGRKFHNKQFGGGIVFQAYECEMQEIIDRLKA